MANRSARRPLKKISTVNLQFPGPNQIGNVHEQQLNNGFRPHGGVRGTNAHPPHPFSFNKPEEYHEQIDQELHDYLDNKNLICAPMYAIDTSQHKTFSGESCLMRSGYLAVSKHEPDIKRPATAIPSPEQKRRERQLYYRPDKAHRYLAATNVSKSAIELGSPTCIRQNRTTILRERHRCNSAPVNSTRARRQLELQIQRSMNYRSAAFHSMKQLLDPGLINGDSVHGFLTGARYNRSHCLDSRSADNFGVYIPRGNPLGVFLVKNDKATEEVPGTPPDSPASGSDGEGCPKSPLLQSQAWDSDIYRPRSRRPHTATNRRSAPLIQQIINLDDGLNISGRGINDPSRMRSARAQSARVRSARATRRPNSALYSQTTTLRERVPIVQIQGKTFSGKNRSQDAIDKTISANDPNKFLKSNILHARSHETTQNDISATEEHEIDSIIEQELNPAPNTYRSIEQDVQYDSQHVTSDVIENDDVNKYTSHVRFAENIVTAMGNMSLEHDEQNTLDETVQHEEQNVHFVPEEHENQDVDSEQIKQQNITELSAEAQEIETDQIDTNAALCSSRR